MKYEIITISREFGSGGRMIGKGLAKRLEIPFYDKELIALTAETSGFSPAIVEEMEQKKTKSLLYSLYMNTQELPISDQIYLAQTKVIQQISQEGPCVIVGRCADYVLREQEKCINVFIHASLHDRVQRVKFEYGMKENNLEGFIRKQDKSKASYYQHFTQRQWGSRENYQLMINSSIGIDTAIDLLESLVKGDGE